MANIRGTTEFPKIYRIGSAEVEDILASPVEITEKLDGSQIGFGIVSGQLLIRSKNNDVTNDKTKNSLFAPAIQTIQSLQEKLTPEWFYYGEAFSSKRHNKLTYDEIPLGNIVLFGIKKEDGSFVSDYKELEKTAERLNIAVAPLIYSGVADIDLLEKLLTETKSKYGAPYIEGIVIKNYAKQGQDSSMTVGKLVAEEFREIKKNRKPKGVGKDIESRVLSYFQCYATQSRWDKAIQHLNERNELSWSTSDISSLIKEIHKDVFEEEEETIKNELWNLLKKDFSREIVKDFAQYYMNLLTNRMKEKKIIKTDE